MLNFIPRIQHFAAVLLLRTWAFWSVAAPVGMTGLCLLLVAGLAALAGAPIGTVVTGFLVDVQEPLAQVSTQLWMTAFILMALFYGVSRQLVRRTLKNPLSAPLAELVAHIGQKIRRMLFHLAITDNSTAPTPNIFPSNILETRGQPPLVALLAGTMPRLE